MATNLFRWSAVALCAALLAACGGGDSQDTLDAAAATAAVQATQAATGTLNAPVAAAAGALLEQSESRRRALAASAVPTGVTVTDPHEAARQLMAYAEANLPAHFPGSPATQSLAPFVFRHYAATGVYLGVVVDEDSPYQLNGVYVMGGAFGAAPSYVGQVTDFITPAAPAVRATPAAAGKAVVVQGSSTTLRVDVQRLNGFTGPVQLALSGLPGGVTAGSVTVAAGSSSAEIPLAAAATAPHSLPTAVTLTVSATFASTPGTAPGTRTAIGRHGVTVTVRGTPGTADTSFGGGAQITQVASSEDYAHAVAVQADGKVLTAGTTAIATGTVVALTRHLRDGGLDATFGTGGKVITQVGARGDSARAIAVQPDGRIVVAGWTDQSGIDANFLVLRYLADGTLDAGFGDGGRFVLPIGLGNGTDRAHALAIQPDGRILVGGTTLTSTSTTGQDFALIRLLANGTLDAGFGTGGKVVTPMNRSSGTDTIYAIALPVVDGEQRILAVGGEGEFIAARYRPDGTLDASFGAGGKVVGLFGRNIGAARAVALVPGGRMLLAGGIYNDFAAAQLMENGTPDPTFGQAGLVIVPVSATNWDNATAVARQADGKLLLGGWAYSGNSSSGDFVALRLLPGGALDPAFGNEGIAIHPVAAGSKSDSARGLVLQPDERIPATRAILGGEVSGSNYDFGLLRLWL